MSRFNTHYEIGVTVGRGDDSMEWWYCYDSDGNKENDTPLPTITNDVDSISIELQDVQVY